MDNSNGVEILTDVQHLKNLLKSLRLKPNEVLGQNFLVSEDALQEILDVAEIQKGETVIEIGPGLGVLTGELVKKSFKVIAIEKDARFAGVLRNVFEESKNLEIVEADALRFNFEKILGTYKIVANIPYYLTSHLIQNLLALKNKPKKIVLMVQKEVGERLTAEAGELSLLGISVQIFADVSIAAVVPKDSFYPKPKVDSCIVVLEPKDKFKQIHDEKLFFRMLKVAFAGKRKQIHNSLMNGFKFTKPEVEKLLAESKIKSSSRPQELEIEDWIRLFTSIQARQE